jgi:hypothetical protein
MLHVGAALAQGHEEELAKKLNNPVAAMKATQ